MKVTVNVPTTLKEIKLSSYQKWNNISKDSEDSFFLQQKMVEIFCNIPLIAVNRMKVSDVEDICNTIVNLFEEETKLVNRVKIKNIEFGFIPQLDDITFGEYVDLDSYVGDWSLMHKAMGVLYRPVKNSVKHLYEIEDYETSDKYDMTEMDLYTVFGSLVFFYNLSNELTIIIQNYLEQQREIPLPQDKVLSMRNGLGISRCTDYQKETYTLLKNRLNLNYTVVSHT